MANGFWQALEGHLNKGRLVHAFLPNSTFFSVIQSISAVQVASIQHHPTASLECLLVVAVEEIVRFMFSDAEHLRHRQFRFGPSLFDALLWALPKVGPSPIIEIYAKRSQTVRQLRMCLGRDTNPAFLVADCLDQYNTRIQNTKLAQLERRIKNGVCLTTDFLSGFHLT